MFATFVKKDSPQRRYLFIHLFLALFVDVRTQKAFISLLKRFLNMSLCISWINMRGSKRCRKENKRVSLCLITYLLTYSSPDDPDSSSACIASNNTAISE
jgi:hypothetical protein